jgi:D-sedoheptulose 7-phosphate isomerase
MKRPAVFLDRDGVINRYAYDAESGTFDSPAHPERFELLPGAGEAIAALNQLKLPVIVVSNQPGIAKGKFTPWQLDAVNEAMRLRLALSGARLDAVYYCRHHPEATLETYRADCDCRKPKPGLLLRAARERNIDLERSFLVGDGVPDILAGRAAGVTTLLLGSPVCTVCEEFSSRGAIPHLSVRDLRHAARVIGETLSASRVLNGDSSLQPAPCVLRQSGKTQAPENGITNFAQTFQQSERERRPEQAPYHQAGGAGYAADYLRQAAEIAARIDAGEIERLAALLRLVRDRGGRLFLVGVGGGAGHASHAACDFRKIAGIEAYSVTDNVSELTARVNDEGWETSYRNWLAASRLSSNDMLFVFSVGGGNLEKNVSANLVCALEYARERGAAIGGIVGRDGGHTAQVADSCVLVPVVDNETITPHTEAFQALVWHLLVSHPALKAAEMKWESLAPRTAKSATVAKVISVTTARI